MSKSRAVPPLEPRLCAWCKGVLSDRRPPFLIMSPSGNVVGEFHAGCAERLILEAERRPETNWLKGYREYGRALPAREETLPW